MGWLCFLVGGYAGEKVVSVARIEERDDEDDEREDSAQLAGEDSAQPAGDDTAQPGDDDSSSSDES